MKNIKITPEKAQNDQPKKTWQEPELQNLDVLSGVNNDTYEITSNMNNSSSTTEFGS